MIRIDHYREFNRYMFPEYYYDILPKTCQYCNHPILISQEKTRMKCSNNSCPKHLSFRAHNMLIIMGVKGIGPATAFSLIQQNKLNNHMDILGLTVEQMPYNSSDEEKNRIWRALQEGRDQPLYKVLEMFAIDNLAEKKSQQLVGGMSSFNELFAGVNDWNDMTNKVSKLLQTSATETVRKISLQLLLNENKLKQIETYFNIDKVSDNKIYICMTKEIVTVYSSKMQFRPRDNFLRFMNLKYEGIISFIGTGNATNANFLLTDYSSMTSKMRTAIRNNVEIMRFSDFVEYIRELYGEGNEEYTIITRG